MLFELFKTFSFWTYNSALGLAIRESKWGFASLEVVHLFGLTILLGSLVMLSLRYLGLTMRKLPINRVARELAPVEAKNTPLAAGLQGMGGDYGSQFARASLGNPDARQRRGAATAPERSVCGHSLRKRTDVVPQL